MTATNGGYLTRADILSMQDVRSEDVAVAAWGGRITRVRAFTARELGWWRTELLKAAGKIDSDQSAQTAMLAGSFLMRVRAVRMCTVDDSGQALFTEEDETELGSKSGDAIDQLFEAVSRLSGLTPKHEAEAVESAEGFSEGTPENG